MRMNKTIGLICILAMAAASNAALVHHWALDEPSLTWNGSGWTGVQESVSSTVGDLWGYTSSTDDLTQTGLGVLGNAGPLGGSDFAYDFAVDTGISGVATNVTTALPATGDFTLLAWIKTDNAHSAQGHVFSNNNAQAGRANLFLQNRRPFFGPRALPMARSPPPRLSIMNLAFNRSRSVPAARFISPWTER